MLSLLSFLAGVFVGAGWLNWKLYRVQSEIKQLYSLNRRLRDEIVDLLHKQREV